VCGHFLKVGDAFGIHAFGYCIDGVRNLHNALFYHLIVTNNIQLRFRSHKGDPVYIIILEKLPCNFYDSLFTAGFAFEVGAKCYLVPDTVKTEYLYYLEKRAGRNVINHCSAFNGTDQQLLLIIYVLHGFLF